MGNVGTARNELKSSHFLTKTGRKKKLSQHTDQLNGVPSNNAKSISFCKPTVITESKNIAFAVKETLKLISFLQ